MSSHMPIVRQNLAVKSRCSLRMISKLRRRLDLYTLLTMWFTLFRITKKTGFLIAMDDEGKWVKMPWTPAIGKAVIVIGWLFSNIFMCKIGIYYFLIDTSFIYTAFCNKNVLEQKRLLYLVCCLVLWVVLWDNNCQICLQVTGVQRLILQNLCAESHAA